jgi:hypothetical protein
MRVKHVHYTPHMSKVEQGTGTEGRKRDTRQQPRNVRVWPMRIVGWLCLWVGAVLWSHWLTAVDAAAFVAFAAAAAYADVVPAVATVTAASDTVAAEVLVVDVVALDLSNTLPLPELEPEPPLQLPPVAVVLVELHTEPVPLPVPVVHVALARVALARVALARVAHVRVALARVALARVALARVAASRHLLARPIQQLRQWPRTVTEWGLQVYFSVSRERPTMVWLREQDCNKSCESIRNSRELHNIEK